MATDTTKITGAADELASGLTKGGTAAKALGTEIAAAFAAQDARITAIEAGGGTQPPIQPPTSNVGVITNFSAASGSEFQIDGTTVSSQNANKSHSIKNPDKNTLVFEVRAGDHWSNSSYNDAPNERSEIEFVPRTPAGRQATMTSLITVAPGPVTQASHVVLAQLHSTETNPPCPVTFQLEQGTDRVQVILQTPDWNRLYYAPKPVVRGQTMDIKIEAKMGSSGYVGVWLDGNKIVNYNGRVGDDNHQYYWKTGIYRGPGDPAPMTSTVRNIYTTN